MSHRNYDPSKCVPEKNDMTYMNIPRTSLRIRDVIDRAIRGAPIDCPDTSDYFSDVPDDDTPAQHRWADMSDHVDANEYSMEMEEKKQSLARKAEERMLASLAEQTANKSTEQSENAPSDKKAKRSKSSAASEAAEVD